eukprot:Colp12_sorted_trinity150504_noHs@3634
MATLAGSSNRNIKLACATLLTNFSAALCRVPGDERKVHVISVAGETLKTEKDSECVYRTLVALGTLVSTDADSLEVSKTLELRPLVSACASDPTPKVKQCAAALAALL